MNSDKPLEYPGAISCDDRGYVRFVNDFNPQACGVKRFYQVSNHDKGFIRAWHGHLHEAKYVYVVNGSIKIGTVRINGKDDDWSLNRPTFQCLTSASPKVLFVPAGYANGFQTLEDNTNVMFFSTSTLADSLADDIRYPWNHWNQWADVWEIKFR